jgi:hypothetical protein
MTQKSAILVYFAAVVWKHAIIGYSVASEGSRYHGFPATPNRTHICNRAQYLDTKERWSMLWNTSIIIIDCYGVMEFSWWW